MKISLLVPGDRCRPYVIGDGKDASFPIDASAMGGREAWVLVEPDGTVCVPPRAGAPAGGSRLQLSRAERVIVSLKPFEFEIKAVSPPPRLRLPLELNWTALAWSSAGVLLFGLALGALLHLGPEMPHQVHVRLGALERMMLSLAGDADEVLARLDGLWLHGPDVPAGREPALACEPVTVIEIGSSSPAVPGGAPGTGHGPSRRQGAGHAIPWSAGGPVEAGQDAGSLLGYGMCMLPAADTARE
jgi:hypothetical protein